MIPLATGIVSSVAADLGVSALQGITGKSTLTPKVDGPSFSEVLGQLTTDAVDTLKSSEATSIAAVQGKASVQQVVDQVMTAERTLQTAIAVRDKAVGAYQEISRMTI
ncbi:MULTISPECIES: flagellar hook-basal body complex protein FliE [Methylosinus]|uniref:Flagellar hook-basal body complex protein FliE n=1 Tax=Methylosinus trichosporium (strain ATCC 35070 / NCIMB 11131 / UNIQEM 75 / OB3b) TaxID=595536 RepID=A0A2D2D3Z9_METT3|nr:MULTISPECIES: flagellar hook-basal body complex protein FliE [Methylosinus]ATQ69694.1 flagellar hook-basal body protein FliE [Methylosinus trichosporium OB3b]OBS51220.1 flagellar hook-basal body protein FliE [Methylosinus sp. 3S-1]